MELKVGKMSSPDIAKWLLVSYNTYRKKADFYLDVLRDYCDFEKVYGGVNITKVYCSTYNKDQNKTLHLDIIKYLLESPTPIAGINAMAQKLGYSKYAVRKACNYCFGGGSRAIKGIVGSKKRIWAVKVEDLANGRYIYRELTKEEKQKLHEYASAHYNVLDEIGNAFDILEEAEDATEVVQKLEAKKKEYYDEVLGKLSSELEGWVVRATIYKIGDREYICTTEQEYSECLREELRRLGYQIPEDWDKEIV